MNLSVKILAPAALIQGKEHPIPTGCEVTWTSDSVWTQWPSDSQPATTLPGRS